MTGMLSYLAVVILSYLLGSIPFAYLVVKIVSGKDIRQYGSGNVGATNAYRIVGIKFAVLVFLLDFLKGLVAVIYLSKLAGNSPYTKIVAALFVLLGHLFTIFLKFKGGKGAATGLGIITALSPIGALTGVVVWIIVLKFGKIVSVATIITALYIPIFSFIYYSQKEINLFILFMSLLVIFMHKSNIKRLLSGTENKIK